MERVEERTLRDTWNKRLKDPLIKANTEQFKAKVNGYTEQGQSFDDAFHHAANDELKLRSDNAQFLTDYYQLQEDPTQQQILDSAKTIRISTT